MSTRFWFSIAAIAVIAALGASALIAWRADQRDRDQLASELAATKQLLATADTRQHDRDAQLAQTLAALAAQKRTVVTPAQIVRELPNNLPLPAPIMLQSETGPVANQITPQPQSAGKPSPKGTPPAPPQAIIPAEDLKPLYDFTLDCKACQAKLVTAQNDLTDERAKTAALTKERDQTLKIARGGSAWRRIGRAAKWFILGAAAGVAISKAH